MKIVIITGSPHKNGTSALLTEQLIKGISAEGNEIFRFDTAFENVHPCIGCDTCQFGKKPCVFKDAMTELYPKVIEANMIIFVTPLYYHAMSSQIKMAIDRFHGIDDLIRGTKKKTMLMMTCGSNDQRITNGVVASYREMIHYLGWEDAGILLAYGCYQRKDIEMSEYPKLAYQLGKQVHSNE